MTTATIEKVVYRAHATAPRGNINATLTLV